MKKRTILALLLILAMVMTSLAGCGKNEEKVDGDAVEKKNEANTATAAPGEDKSGTATTAPDEDKSGTAATASKYQTTYGSKQFDNVTIHVELFDRSNAPEGSTITDNKWTRYVNEQMNKVGINVEFVAVPRSDEVSKMQTMMSSGTAPDLTITYTYSYAQEYLQQGGIWELSEFIEGEDQAKNMKAYLGQNVLDIGRNTNNELFGIVAKRATTAKSNIFLRKDWLDKLNLSMPTTADELFNVVEKMVNSNPDSKSNIVGASFWGLNDAANSACYRNNLALAFSKLNGDKKELDIAHGFDYYYDPGIRDYFKFVNRMYNAGLIDKEYYTMTTDTYNSDIVTGSMGLFETNVNYNVDVLRGSLLKTLQENEAQADIVSMPSLINPNDGNQYSATYAAGGLVAFCPKTASEEVVEACMTYLDWMCTEEGGFVLYHGFEGEHYNMIDGVPVVKDAAYNATDKDWIRTDIFLVGNQGYFSTVDDFNACTSKETPGYESYVVSNYENSIKGVCVDDTTYTSPSTPELKTDLNLLCEDYIVKCVSCPEGEFDALYDEFMAACKDAGIDTIIKERTDYYNELYK